MGRDHSSSEIKGQGVGLTWIKAVYFLLLADMIIYNISISYSPTGGTLMQLSALLHCTDPPSEMLDNLKNVRIMY